MGLRFAKLDADSNKFPVTKTPECGANCERLVIDGLTRTKFETVEKIFKEFFHDKNQLDDFRKAKFEKSSSGYRLKYVLEEPPKISSSIASCISNKEALIRFHGSLPNIIGDADILRSDIRFNSDKTINGNICYKGPIREHGFKPNLNLALSCQNKKPADLGFQVTEQKVSCGVDFQLCPNVKHFLNWEGALRHQTCHGLMSMVARANCGYSLKSSLKHTLVFDNRDLALFPTEGNRVNFTTEVSGLGGNVSYLKNDLKMQHIFSLPRDIIMETSFGCGLLNAFNCESKYMDTFKLGGPLSVRGFQTNGIDPKNDCVSSYWVGNIHLYLPFIKKPQNCDNNIVSHYHTQLFVNSGNLGSGNNCLRREITDLTNGFRMSCGVGLIVSIKALGRIEVNYCIPLRYQEYDRTVSGLQVGIHFDFL